MKQQTWAMSIVTVFLIIAALRALNKDWGLFTWMDPLVCTPCYTFQNANSDSIFANPHKGEHLFLEDSLTKQPFTREGGSYRREVEVAKDFEFRRFVGMGVPPGTIERV